MKLEFKLYQIKQGTRSYKNLIEKGLIPNQLIIIGEEKINDEIDTFLVKPMLDNQIKIFEGMKINECTMNIKKDELELCKDGGCSYQIAELDIPKKYLTMSIIEDIQRLNNN